MRQQRLEVAFIALVALLIGTGCGETPSDEERIRAAIEESVGDLENIKHLSPADYCDTRIIPADAPPLSKAHVQLSLERTEAVCDALSEKDLKSLGEHEVGDLHIGKITIEGRTARTVVTGKLDGEPTRESTVLIRDNEGIWRLTTTELP